MANIELKLPKMGESVAEATITNWLKEVGDTIEADEAVLEIATDKVDSEVPSEVDGVLKEKLFDVDDVVQVGQTIAIIEAEGESSDDSDADSQTKKEDTTTQAAAQNIENDIAATQNDNTSPNFADAARFYSPLVKNIAKEEGISLDELEKIEGSGLEGRVTKDDMLSHVKNRGQQPAKQTQTAPQATPQTPAQELPKAKTPVNINAEDEVTEMTRMGKMIASHMTNSKQTSAHVQSFIEVDVTNIWNWRNKHKKAFQEREGEKLTFTPIFMEAVAQTIKDFPGINIQVDGTQIIKKKNINLGMAAALPNGDLIVPVIHNADQLNLLGMAKKVNDLAGRARIGKLKPDETQGGTYTVTNVGTFGSVFGTPIINQPQVGILALGAIRKVPAVIETPEGDFIGIRYKMFLSHSYDHRVVNGALGGQFVQQVANLLESFDPNRTV